MTMQGKIYQVMVNRWVLAISFVVLVLAVLGVGFWGLGAYHVFFENPAMSTAILSGVFFLFITIGLFRGVNLKDTFGRIVEKFSMNKPSGNENEAPRSNVFSLAGVEVPDVPDGLMGVITSVFLWGLITVVVDLSLWAFTNVLAVTVVSFVVMLYWVFFRAARLVFRNSNRYRGNLLRSMALGVSYAILYNFWIYGVFMMADVITH